MGTNPGVIMGVLPSRDDGRPGFVPIFLVEVARKARDRPISLGVRSDRDRLSPRNLAGRNTRAASSRTGVKPC